METPHNTTNTKEFEVTGVSRSGRVRKKSSKLLDFQSPDEVERKIYKRTTNNPSTTRGGFVKYSGRGRPSLAALKARKEARVQVDEDNDIAPDDEEINEDVDNKEDEEEDMDLDTPVPNSDEDDDEEHFNDVLHNSSGLTAVSDSDDDGFGELVADLVGTEAANLEGSMGIGKSQFRQSLYMTEKNTKRMKEGRLERKDKGKSRYTAYSMWAREHRKSSKFGKNTNISKSAESMEAARRLSELWSNVSNKEKNAWRRKAKMQATRAKQRERAGITTTAKVSLAVANNNSQNSFINRPTTSRTRKLAEDKQKAKDELAVSKPTASTPKRPRNNSYRRMQNTTQNSHNSSNSSLNSSIPLYVNTNGASSTYNDTSKALTINNIKTPLPTIEPIDAAAHLKLLGESLSIIGDRLKEHEGQIAVSGSLSVLLDSLLCSLGPLLCLTTRLPGLDKKPQLKANLATTLDNIAYVMPGL